jgi:flagella basal body P-ring formation protein FlgA
MMRRQWLILGLLASLPAPLPARAQEPAPPATVQAAITAAVQARMGEDAIVTVVGLEVTDLRPTPVLRAVPDPNARIGERMHFRLLGADVHGGRTQAAGRAVALVGVEVEHVRARTLVERGRELRDGDLERSRVALSSLPLRRLPRLAEVAGSRALVNLAPGEIVTSPSVASRPAVRSGQLVRAVARIGELEVSAALTAVQDGVEGAVIRVVNKESRRELRARVVEPGVVEVTQ